MNKKLIVALTAIVLLLALFINTSKIDPTKGDSIVKNTTDIDEVIPKDSYLREVKDIPGEVDKKLVVYIEEPKFDEEFDLYDIQTCHGERVGQGIEGIYHLALYEDGRFYQDIILPSVWDSGKDEKTNRQKLAYKNTKANAYAIFGGEKYEEHSAQDPVEVQIVQFGNYTYDSNSVDFKIAGPAQSCGNTFSLYGGYHRASDVLVLYPLKYSEETYYWGNNFRPDRRGLVKTEFICGDHGNNTHTVRYYQFQASESAYMLEDEIREEC